MIPDWLPPEWDDAAPDEPVLAYGTCTPSGWLALDLDSATTDPAGLSDDTLIEAMVGFDRVGSWAAARQARLLAELARRRPTDRAPYSARWAGVGSEYAPDEVGVALHLARGTACARIGLACRLLATLPDTFALWEAGRIDTAKARAVDDATVVLSDELARAVQDRVLPRAPEQTLAQLKAALARAVIAADPDGAEARHRQARRDRRVVVTAEPDGMGTLWAMLTATDAAGAFTWLTRLARGLGAEDPRSMDARRADILAALLNGRPLHNADTDTSDTDTSDTDTSDTDTSDTDTSDTDTSDTDTSDTDADAAPGGSEPDSGEADDGEADDGVDGADVATGPGRPIQPMNPGKPLIQVLVPYSTLIGADDHPAELVGHGPIPACLAREVAADGVWRRLVTDPVSGTLLDHGRTTYHPPAGLADHVRARDVHCRFPGCRKKAADAELDHITAWSDGGHTSEPNLAGYCTHHHRLKTHAEGWHVHAQPGGGLRWTTPTGHQHTTGPHDYRPDPAPPPASERHRPALDAEHEGKHLRGGADPAPPPF